MDIFDVETFQEEGVLQFEDIGKVLKKSEQEIHNPLMAFDHEMKQDEESVEESDDEVAMVGHFDEFVSQFFVLTLAHLKVLK